MSSLLLPQRRKQSISLTALIDVVFILLMFFMLTSSFTKFSAVEMQSSLAASVLSDSKPQLLRLSVDGQLSYAQVALGDSAALTDAALSSEFDASMPTVLQPAAETQVQVIVDALSRMKVLGFTQVTLGKLRPQANAIVGQK
ncbi:biopolymer transport protein ExbD [Paraglaciecola mesophila KMM 241]|uniref:Biopolymer transport protein ExbD n=1 Tax=Paraglaciecola mesophila KMM 241 TaxID=1128912 RepID=K6ZL49_9ALTE|nr:biopolymer transporter ExbD [Paraglaciecola mesophila]GAC24085.1 biopolymer transport protein ExbD [Paraglaciecola mesophila KMM 241]